jgi:phosphohistidine phosphatase
MIIYFLRHASAGQSMSNLKKDEKRPLDKEGIEQCGIVGRALSAMDVQADAIISSPLKRAAQTASLVGNELSYEGKFQLEDALRPGASFADFRRMLDKYASQEAIMVVGHNPNLSQFLGRIIGDAGCEAGIDLRKGAVAKVEMARNSANLQWCLTPKIVRTIYAAAVAESSRPKTSRK